MAAVGPMGETMVPEPTGPLPPPLTSLEAADQVSPIIACFSLMRTTFFPNLGPPALSSKVKFMTQLGQQGGTLPSEENITRAQVAAAFAKITRGRHGGGFGLRADSYMTVEPVAVHYNLPAARTPAALGSGDLLLTAPALAPWRAQLLERAREVAFHHQGTPIGNHAHAAYVALNAGQLAGGLTRLFHCGRMLAANANHGGKSSAGLLGWIGEALEVSRLRANLPDATIYWVNALNDLGLECMRAWIEHTANWHHRVPKVPTLRAR